MNTKSIPVIELEDESGIPVVAVLSHIVGVVKESDDVSIVFINGATNTDHGWYVKANFDDLKAAIERGESCNMRPVESLTASKRVHEMVNNPNAPIDLTGLSSGQRASVMAHRPDCPIDMTGLTSYDRARVMACRPDCPIDMTGLNGPERVKVMTSRPDYKPGKG